MFLKVNDRRLFVHEEGPGNGPAVVLLHHGLGAVPAWRNQIPVIARAGYRVVAYDRWGYGQSEPRQHLNLPGFEPDLADLDAILDQLGLENPILVGHSDGGTIALYYAAQNTRPIEKLVTIAAHIYVEPKMETGIEEVRMAYETDPRFQEGIRRMHGEKARQVFYNWYDGWARQQNLNWDMRPLLGRISCPALVVQGVEDEHAEPAHARDIAQAISGAMLWLAPGVQHMFPLEQPETFNAGLIAFLKGEKMPEGVTEAAGSE